MNKKVNTLLFILGATLFNVLVTLLILAAFVLFYFKIVMVLIPEVSPPLVLFLFFIAALAVSFLIYRCAVKQIINKVDLEKYFDPIFIRRNIKKS
jgi:phosphoglycerol transferase MdoB-like AlkP superfamily enzyme